MKSPFRSKYKITQEFGPDHFLTINGKQIKASEYYGKFGLSGHEGIDMVPTGTSWEVLSLSDGVLVNESDDPRSGAYGIWCTIWSPSNGLAFQYCHLSENYIRPGDKITAGQKIGNMGSTGNSSGAHLHLNVFKVDDKGVRINKDNGYNGGIDPLPFLSSEDAPVNDVVELDKCRVARDTHWNHLMQIKDALMVQGEYSISNIINRIDSLSTSERQLGEKDKQLSSVQTQLTDLQGEMKSKIDEYINLQASNESLQKQVKTQEKKIEEFGIAMRETEAEIERLKAIKPLDDLTAGDHLVKFFVKLFVKR